MGDQLRTQMQQLLAAFAQLSERTQALEKKAEEQRARFDAEKEELRALFEAEKEELRARAGERVEALQRQLLMLAKETGASAFALAQLLPANARLHYVSWADAKCRNASLKLSTDGYRVTGSGAKTHEVARAASGVTEGVHCFAVRVENIGSAAFIFVGWCDAQLNVNASSFTGYNGALGASFYMFNGCYYHGPTNGHHEAPAGGGVGQVQRPATIAALLDLDAGRMTVYVDGTALAPCAYAFPKDREWFPLVSTHAGGSLVSLDLEAAVAAARGAPA